MASAGNIASRWEKLSGVDNWSGLLDPLDIDLRRHILIYGDLVEAVGDAFNNVKVSKNYGTSRYSKANFFDRVGLVKGNPFRYQVTKFTYAAAELKFADWMDSSFIGYVAVATDEGKEALGRRDIVVAWRGTILQSEWKQDIQLRLVSASELLGDAASGGGAENPRVHEGILSIYTSVNENSTQNKISARDQVLTEIRRLVDLYADEEMSVTISGHSMGSAVATLCAADIVANGFNKPTGRPDRACVVTAIVTASPRVGDSDFKLAFSAMENLRLLRVGNAPYIVPNFPLWIPILPYVDIGEELLIDTRKSSYLKDSAPAHNQPVYLHGVAGTQGSRGGFELEVDRDIALANKEADALMEDYRVPAAWWQVKNKGMVQAEDGTWNLDDDPEEDDSL
ncbi:hypothetical protein ACLOJK_010486 [Asimina triloba]